MKTTREKNSLKSVQRSTPDMFLRRRNRRHETLFMVCSGNEDEEDDDVRQRYSTDTMLRRCLRPWQRNTIVWLFNLQLFNKQPSWPSIVVSSSWIWLIDRSNSTSRLTKHQDKPSAEHSRSLFSSLIAFFPILFYSIWLVARPASSTFWLFVVCFPSWLAGWLACALLMMTSHLRSQAISPLFLPSRQEIIRRTSERTSEPSD